MVVFVCVNLLAVTVSGSEQSFPRLPFAASQFGVKEVNWPHPSYANSQSSSSEFLMQLLLPFTVTCTRLM